MNNKKFADLGFLAIAAVLAPLTYFRAFEHKSASDYRKSSSLTR